ncbi:MAG: 5-methyltetrahydropteroyltriglutamate--homocysteine S-methyltransferase [Solirubrobacterales bacterium]|nr:5-methyltetrahydropteroyltriglutamate--homocysteine S-methyltransferase [Solirubrobacterales bacterium]
MARTAVLGFPRIGPDRELKFALEEHWAGRIEAAELQEVARGLRELNLQAGRGAGIDVLPVGDFALYDHVLDTAELASIIAERHGGVDAAGLSAHFLACRGADGVAPLEMTKWFDTNYHYLVAELRDGQRVALRAESLEKWRSHLAEAQRLGIKARPVVLGPFSLLSVSKGVSDPLTLLPAHTEVYAELLAELARAGATEVQIDEPCLVLDQSAQALDMFTRAYVSLLSDTSLPVCLATYFGGLDDAVLAGLRRLPLGELHVDLVRAPERLDAVLSALGPETRLSAGVVDGRNVWATDLDQVLDRLDRAATRIGTERLTIAPSCSLLHVPYTAARELALDDELRSWLAFGNEKLAELALLGRALDADAAERDELLANSRQRGASRRKSPRTNDSGVRARAAALTGADLERSVPLAERRAAQTERLRLPQLPTTTIGSFPQTAEIRDARRRRRTGELSEGDYLAFLRRQIDDVIETQEQLGFDVLVHGEPERNDMVEYFGEQLAGFAFSEFGWVQSYGSRAVKPPILYGDVSRPEPMTVGWWKYAQSRSQKPVKAMLTGPVTVLQWSFVRDDQPRQETCRQIALAIRDEVADLDAAGAAVIQVDEAALREGLPLRRAEQGDYLRWAIDCFRLAVAPVQPETQLHTHMCYSEFGSMIEEIARLDADVISIEASRSGMELLEAFRDYAYPGQIGPGIYDIHSPRVPNVEELESLLALAEERIPREQLWVNPDCGLKTRAWPETQAALENLVAAARRRRSMVASQS